MEIRSDGPRGPAVPAGEPGRSIEMRRTDEPAAFRLEPGRVVVGMLLRWLEAGTALMLIDGVRVRARVETPLAVGQSAWLYVDAPTDLVSPEGVGRHTGGDVVLRVVQAFSRDEAESAAVWLKALAETGVRASEAQWAALARLPARLDAFLAHRPDVAAEYARAAAVAVAGRLPVEPEVVRALRAAMFGEPLGRRLIGFAEAVDREIARLVRLASAASIPQPERVGTSSERSDAAEAGAEEAVAWLRRLAAVLASVNESVGRLADLGGAGEAKGNMRFFADTGDFEGGGPTLDDPNRAIATASSRGESSGETATDAATAGRLFSPLTEEGDVSTFGRLVFSAAEVGEAADGPGPNLARARAVSGRPVSGQEDSTAGSTERMEAEDVGGRRTVPRESDVRTAVFDRFVRFWKQLGLDWEASVFRRFVADSLHVADEGAAPFGDSLKPLLSLISASDAVSPEFRQTAQSLLQHLTGQQLLLLGDRQDASAVLTMQIPFVLPDGGTSTATVYVRSRVAGRRIDPNHCWLRFDLRLARLGETVIDVVVSDRTVSLLVLNDVSQLAAWLEAARPILEEALRGAGYRLAGVRWKPLSLEKPTETESGLRAVRHYVLTSQGVDIRI